MRPRFLVFVVLAVAFARLGLASAADPSLPNIIVIYTDDQGFGDVSGQNPEAKFETTHLDRMAREGLRFTDAHCSDTVCTPSRYGLLTGRYSWRTTLKRGVFGAEGACLIADGRWTLASLLKQKGYATGMSGKWHLGMDFPGSPGDRDWRKPVRDMPLDKGFDYYFGIPASMNYGVLAWFEGRFAAVPPTLYTAKKPNRIAINDYRMTPPYEPTPERVKQSLGKAGLEVAADFDDVDCLQRFTDKALEWMERQLATPEPFFLYIAYTSPHKPVIPRPEFRGQGQAGAYGEFMIETDAHVGRVFKFLAESGIDENTLVVFTCDNGPETTWRERARRFAHQSNGPYREGKRSIYEGGHRVPFLIRWPQGIEAPGRAHHEPICQTDLLATLAELVSVPLPAHAGEDSQSFLHVFRDPAAARERAPIIHHAANGRFAIRDGRWKLVMAHRNALAELYDLQSDPSESRNVIKENQAIASRLTSSISSIVREGRSTPGPPQRNDTGYWPDLHWLSETEYGGQE